MPRAPEANGARGTNKGSFWPPRTLSETASLALIEAVLESKYLKCLLVRRIFALVSIAKRRTILLRRRLFISSGSKGGHLGGKSPYATLDALYLYPALRSLP